MRKINLPVMILRGITLLPYNEIRLEFDNETSKNIVSSSEYFHDNQILIISTDNLIDINSDIELLPKFGVVAKISHKVDLPNNGTRILLTGLYRAKVLEYLEPSDEKNPLESKVQTLPVEKLDTNLENTLKDKVLMEISNYLENTHLNNPGLIDAVKETTTLEQLADLIPTLLGLSSERLEMYLEEASLLKRVELVLEDIYLKMEILSIDSSIEERVTEAMEQNQKEYILREKMKVIKEDLGEQASKEEELDLLKESVEKLKAPKKIKERINTELRRYESLSSANPEVNIIRNYIDWMLSLPWKVTTKDIENLKAVEKSLDDSHYGLDKVKTRIIEYLAVKKQTNSLKGPIICLVGPPGVGKTSLAFSVAEAMGRNFVKISLGGVGDESEIIGHRRTYLGASPGRIIQSLKKAKSNNPIFLIDEIDKMTKDYKGDPAATMLEILDPEQNEFFSDNYIEEEFDLSNVMFIATANYLGDIPEALRDRLEIVELSGYTEFEKVDIAKKHLLPKICKEHGIKESDIKITDAVLLEIIRSYTKEAGVRELERQLATSIRKIITDFVKKDIAIKPTSITKTKLESLLGKTKYNFYDMEKIAKVGSVNGLAYTSYGGDTLSIEVNYFEGTGKLILTGSLGDVMKESATIALNYIKANYKTFGIDYKLLTENDIHIHVPAGATPKDGPSAGITLTTALISAFKKIEIPYTLAMTGEVTLRGDVLAIGGLKEKSIGASRVGIKEIIIPKDNVKDLDDIPKEIKDSIKYIPVEKYSEIYNIISGLK